MYEAKILADSISDAGYRLTTMQVTFPRFVLAEVNTHRMFSRNSASSRAIPVHKSIKAVRESPFKPAVFEANQKGMVGGQPIGDQEAADLIWGASIADAIFRAEQFDNLEVHKGIANRVLEPYKWHTAIVTATEWENFFALRTAPDAQPEFRTIAEMMLAEYRAHEPRELSAGQLHIPLVFDDEIENEARQWPEPYIDWEMWSKISIGRCARVSYLTHDGVRDLQADLDLHDRLAATPPHLSPFEHVARPFTQIEWDAVDTARNAVTMIYSNQIPEFVDRMCRQMEFCANLRGYVSRRAEIPNEHDASLVVPSA